MQRKFKMLSPWYFMETCKMFYILLVYWHIRIRLGSGSYDQDVPACAKISSNPTYSFPWTCKMPYLTSLLKYWDITWHLPTDYEDLLIFTWNPFIVATIRTIGNSEYTGLLRRRYLLIATYRSILTSVEIKMLATVLQDTTIASQQCSADSFHSLQALLIHW